MRPLYYVSVAVLSSAVALPALADEPITLTDLQLDQVSAAGNRLDIDVIGDNITDGSFFFDNLPGFFSTASLSYSQINFSGVVETHVLLEADTFD